MAASKRSRKKLNGETRSAVSQTEVPGFSQSESNPRFHSTPWNATWISYGVPLVLVLTVLVTFSNSFEGVFVLDDHAAIEDNLSIKNVFDLWAIITSGTQCTVVGRPLLNLSLAIDYHFFGKQPFWYHLTNLAIHAASGIVLFGWLIRTFSLEKSGSVLNSRAVVLAFGATLLWLVHPLQVGSVTYIVQRAEAMMGFLYLFSLYTFLRSVTAPSGRGRWWLILAIVSCYLGALTKEVVATFPLICLLYDRTFLAGTFQRAIQLRKGLYLALALVWIPIAVLVLSSRQRGGSAGFGLGVTPWDYAWTQTWFITHYLRSSLWPDSLVFDHGTFLIRSIPEGLPFACLIVALLAATVWALRYHPIWGFWGCWFFVILSPTSSIVPLAGQTGAEHRMYLPLIAVAVIFIITFDQVFRRNWFGKTDKSNDPSVGDHSSKWVKWSELGLILVAACALGIAANGRSGLFRDELLIWMDVVKKLPQSARAYNGCGTSLFSRGDYSTALAAFDRALAIDPSLLMARFNRGRTLVEMGRAKEGIEDLTSAIERNPRDILGWLLLCRAQGSLATETGNTKTAEESLETIKQLEAKFPWWPRPPLERGVIEAILGRDRSALESWNRSLRLDPDLTDVYIERARFYVRQEQYDAAITDLTHAIDLKPRIPRYYLDRAEVYDLRHDDVASHNDKQKAASLEISVPESLFH